MFNFKKTASILIIVTLLLGVFGIDILATEQNEIKTVVSPSVSCRSAILMEATTGKVLYEQNADEALPPASVTKIMTLLLVMEAIEDGKLKYDDVITASAYACSMGGSQIYLKEGEQMSAEDMIKSVVIASANDAAVALAEHICGSEDAFVARMNERASELGMNKTNFENTNGLDDTADNHVTSARDIAIMSRELIKYKKITEYSSIWMDSIRNGEFGLTNTNRLVRYYKGATGLKTGSTSKAGFCISATAKRGEMELICVIMGSETRDIRNASATSLLDWGFTNFSIYRASEFDHAPIKISGGKKSDCKIEALNFATVTDKKFIDKIQCEIDLDESINAPIKSGEVVGKIIYKIDETEIGRADIIAVESVEKTNYFYLFFEIIYAVLLN